MSLHRLRVLVMRKLSARHRGWSALERAMVCAVAWLCIPLLTPLAHADFLYHLNDVGIQAYGGGVFYSVNGMNHAGVVAGTYMIVIDQADRRAYAAGQDLDLLFNGFFGFGPTGESVYGVDTQGNVYGSVRAPQTSDTDFTPLISDFVATRSSDGSARHQYG